MHLSPMPMFAEAGGGGFNFSGFQETVHEAWQFVVPNVTVLVVGLVILKVIVRLDNQTLVAQLDGIQAGLRGVSLYLKKTGLFGTKLLPAIVGLAIIVAGLDVFEFLRHSISNLLPPRVIFTPVLLYGRLADDELLTRLLVREGGMLDDFQLYEQIVRWEERVRNDAKLDGAESAKHWEESAGEWGQHGSDVKLLALVALASAGVAIAKRRKGAFWRPAGIMALLCIAYGFCLAKELYAQEQKAQVVLASLGLNLRDQETDEVRGLLRRRQGEFDSLTRWMTLDRAIPQSSWWRLEFGDAYFFKRVAWLFGIENAEQQKRPPLLTPEEVAWLKARMEAREAASTNHPDVRIRTNSPSPTPH